MHDRTKTSRSPRVADLVARLATLGPRGFAERLGVQPEKIRTSSEGVRVPCPAHVGHDHNCAIGLRAGEIVWFCHSSCGEGGDALDLIAAVEGLDITTDFPEVLDEAEAMAPPACAATAASAERHETDDPPEPPPSGASEASAAGAPRTPRPTRQRPPRNEVRALWRAAISVTDDSAHDARRWLESRGLDAARVAAAGLVRVIAHDTPLPPWAAVGDDDWCSSGHRIIAPVWDSAGRMRSVRACATTPTDAPKRLAARGFTMGGLVLANPTAVAMLRGDAAPDRVVIVEGEPDYLTWSTRGDDDVAILGLTGSGSWSDEVAARIPDGARVAVRVDHDKAGDQYARIIIASLAGRCRVVRSQRPDVVEGKVPDDNDLLRRGQLADDPFADSEPVCATASIIRSRWREVGLAALTDPPPPRRWLLRYRAPDDDDDEGGVVADGMLPRGIVAMLSAAGGLRKTWTMVALGFAIVTGRRWLGTFDVDADARGGRVLLALAEEDALEVRRRLYAVARALSLTDAEICLCAKQIVELPLAGSPVALTTGEPGAVQESDVLHDLRKHLESDAGDRGWALIVLDPLARWAGVGAEASNEVATRFIQAVETLATVPGRPTVLVVHHSSKFARRESGVDARGVTALTDAVRWHATMAAPRRSDGATDDDTVQFAIAKSNYTRRMTEALELRYDSGILVPLSAADRALRKASREQAQSRQQDDEVERIVDAVARLGSVTRIDTACAAARINCGRGRVAFATALDRGLIVQSGRAYTVATHGGTAAAPDVFVSP